MPTLSQIDPQRFYRLSDIAGNGWILNTFGQPDRRYVWRLVQAGILPATDFSKGAKLPLWMVKGSVIIRFRKRTYA